jgi:dienelactone hydrolase
VAVQTGEGTIEIIYGSTSIPAGPQTLSGYLARPDAEGEWPTVLLFGPEPEPSSSVKNICRVFARHGIAAIAPDLTESHDANAPIASGVAAFVADPAGAWANAQFGYGVLAFGAGLHDAARLARNDGRVAVIASVSSTLEDSIVEDLAFAQIPALWVGSRADDSVDTDASIAARDALPQTTFVVHADAEQGFWDDGSDGFDEDISEDTIDRLIVFFASELPPRV